MGRDVGRARTGSRARPPRVSPRAIARPNALVRPAGPERSDPFLSFKSARCPGRRNQPLSARPASLRPKFPPRNGAERAAPAPPFAERPNALDKETVRERARIRAAEPPPSNWKTAQAAETLAA
jgi:hypothetical protein